MTKDASDPENLPLLLRTIESTTGFDCVNYSTSFLSRRIGVRLRAVKATTFTSYAQLLRVSPEECDRLKREFTIHTTGFFRDLTFWRILEQRVLPQLLSKKHGMLRIWSAGCSTGEEPLSLAIACAEVGTDLGRVSILATDLDRETIARARTASYEEQQFREMPSDYKAKYFAPQQNDTFSPDPALLRLITYEQGDIISTHRRTGFDLILCRNTVIYFDAETKRELYLTFADCLVPDGFLVIGKTEILQGPAHDLFKIFDSKERIYQKKA